MSCVEGNGFSPLRFYEWWCDDRFDRVHGVDTLERVNVDDLGVVGGNAEHAVYYQPSPVVPTRRLLERLPIRHGEFSFIDFGSGKGRVLLLASDSGFRRVIGLEFSPKLSAIAEANIARYSDGARGRAHSICIDATQFEIPDENLVLYFYNPFDEQVLSTVIARIGEAAARYGRAIYIVYHFLPNPSLLKRLPGFRCVQEWGHYVIYANR